MKKDEKKPRLWTRLKAFGRKNFSWLFPGLGYKRWLLLTILGAMLLGLGLAVLVLEYYHNADQSKLVPVLAVLSLRFLDRPIRFLLFGGLGLTMILVGVWGANRALLRPFDTNDRPAIETLQHYRKRERGLKIVVVGGGHGLSSILRGLKEYSHNLTAIVTVADDGGSSGALRRDMGVLPPGDIRNCLAALSDDEALISQVFQYRFSSGVGLEGHSLGNLFITALAEITGSFEEAVAESGRVLAINGKVLPSTLTSVVLCGEVQDPKTGQSTRVLGESEITEFNGHIQRVWLEPGGVVAYPPTLQAILNADLVLVGPGSLYTSILPNLLVKDITDALRATRAEVYYICNVASQKGETDGFTASDHLAVLEKHVGTNLFDLVMCNRNFRGDLGANAEWVVADAGLYERYKVHETDLIDESYPWRHASRKIAKAVIDLYEERTGPLS